MFWSTRPTYSSTFPPVLAALMKLFVKAPLVGNGMNWSRNCEVGLIRPAGITLPAKAVRLLSVVRGLGLTVSGSKMVGTPAAEKSPVRSAAVGTVVVKTVPERRRYASQL